MNVGDFSVFCSEYPYGHETGDELTNAPSRISHTLIVQDSTDGSVRTVILLADEPLVEVLWTQLENAGLSEAEAREVTDGFHIPRQGDVQDRLYEP